MELFIWIGICFCISQSAMFSGLNLAFFNISKLRLEIEASKGNASAKKILLMRQDANFLLTTILWGNVSINVLLTLLSDSVLAGISAFLFSTVLITFVGEIFPQAYFSRHAIKTAALFSPLLRIYQFLFYPVAKPTALILDQWLGREAIQYFREEDFQELVKMHIQSSSSDIGKVEGTGVINFLAIDDLAIIDEGKSIDPKSIITLPFNGSRPIFPPIEPSSSDPLLNKIASSGKKWAIVTDQDHEARVVINSDSFLRDVLFCDGPFNPYLHCHRPVIVKDTKTPLGETLRRLKVHPKRKDDDIIDEDIILVWNGIKRIITGSDILGRLLKNIARKEKNI